MRSLGIVVYPDGSQAEIIEHETGAPIWETWTEVIRLKKPRRLTLAPFYLLISVLLLLVGCVHLPVKGDKPICLLDMKTGVKLCNYDTWQACHADMQDYQQCYHR